ncbi:MAG TPA: error-prone DNA polymerase [Povalibacter sp.]|uniref:error-prone DNA polymerase n=1 Tax=Povalibacter sp. TaxID=1962978 RepID=UPI002BD32DE6|nr:error-prone DNA polymerase [Povalibacter sp.]HMN43593.1 error-prone DNA polymerase [Povalibacter sp.]
MNAAAGYAELHCLSNFTFLRGASHPQELVLQAEALGYEALAITDECSMAGVVRAHEAARKAKCRLKLIVGSEFHTSDGMHLVLLAPTQIAYAQICALITLAREKSPKGRYQLHRSQLEANLTECLVLWIPPPEPLISQAGWLRNRFPDRCWIAVELHRGADDESRLAALRQLSASSGVPLVAAGDVHMHVRERRALQDTVTAIRHGCTIEQAGHRLLPNGERHLRTRNELQSLYPAALLAETVRIAGLCRFSLGSLKYHYPHELVPQGLTATEHLRQLTEEGLKYRWPNGLPEKVRPTVEKELGLIAEMGYEHFFLTVHELVNYARSADILCQGRGSAANSIVCYALRITEVNPELIDTLFERFISKERNEPPDIDVDFEHERREEVIQHVYEKYGRERAAIAATVITYRVRSAIRDVGKALGIDADIVDRLAKSHAWWDTWESFFASLQKQGLHLEAGVGRRLHALIQDLRGFPRHLSQHVGGFVIAEESISRLVPIENAAMPDRTIIQWDKNDLETLGLLKVDVLALGMLTAIRRSFDLLKRAGTGPTSMSEIPREDSATYDMICRADTIGVFQIESRAQMSMLPRLQPRNYYDLVIEIAIVRPGPIKGGMVHPYLKRRGMRAEDIPYAKEALRPILQKTRGVPIFQEQVMQIAITAAGFKPGEADELRRAMGSWEHSGTMNTYQQKLMEGMAANGYAREFAEAIYQQIEGFGEYGFPESHSASFALLTYISSWLKCHRPAAFFAGLINSQPMGFYQPAQLLEQAKRQGLGILPIDVNVSEWDCTLEPDAQGKHGIRLGFRLVRGLREPEGEKIVAARGDRPFFSVKNVADRTALAKRAMRALALGGVFRSITDHRNIAFWNALGVEHLPGMLDQVAATDRQITLPAPSEAEEILRDYRQLGFSTGRHPLALLRSRLLHRGIVRRRDLESLSSGSKVSVSGLVTHLQHPQTAKGVIFASLEDETGINNIIFWPGVFEEFRHEILQSNLMAVEGELQNQDGVVHVVAERVEDLTPWVRSLPRNSRDFQ